MNSKEIYRLITTILCIVIFIHCTTSQPLSTSAQTDDDDIVDKSMWIKSSSDSELSDDSVPKLFFVHSEYNDINPPNSSEPVRRANFWKRANFWRKRANFWRRDIAK